MPLHICSQLWQILPDIQYFSLLDSEMNAGQDNIYRVFKMLQIISKTKIMKNYKNCRVKYLQQWFSNFLSREPNPSLVKIWRAKPKIKKIGLLQHPPPPPKKCQPLTSLPSPHPIPFSPSPFLKMIWEKTIKRQQKCLQQWGLRRSPSRKTILRHLNTKESKKRLFGHSVTQILHSLLIWKNIIRVVLLIAFFIERIKTLKIKWTSLARVYFGKGPGSLRARVLLKFCNTNENEAPMVSCIGGKLTKS